MKKFTKIFLTGFMAFTIFTTTNIPVLAVSLPGTIHETKKSNHIASGVTHEKIERFTTSGWWHINVVRVDLGNPYTQVQGMINPSGLSNRDTVSAMVEKTGAVSGINGDYFSYQPIPNSIGTLINNGEIISSPIEKSSYAAPSLFMTEDNQTVIGYMDRSIKLINRTQNKTLSPYCINRIPTDFTNIGILTKHWGDLSIGNKYNEDLIEVVVSNDVVIDVRENLPGTTIPKDGYVLFARGDNGVKLKEFFVGDELELDIKINPDLENIKFAIGGGSIILKNGEVTLTNIHSGGNNPRTGIGVNQDNTELIMVTLDGSGSYKGVGQKTFGAIMKELGAYNALNLDGGGSTTMAIKAKDDEKVSVVNNPSGGSQRKVVNGVGVYSDAPVEELEYIELSTEDTNVFANTRRRLVVKGFDKHRNPKPIDESLINFTTEGVTGRFEGRDFFPDEKGITTITAEYQGFTSSLELKVLDKIQHLDTYMAEFTVTPEGIKELPNFNGYDGNGNKAKVSKYDVELNVINNIGFITETRDFNAISFDAAGGVSAKAGNGSFNILATVGNAVKLDVKDPMLPQVSTNKDLKRTTAEKVAGSFSIGVGFDPKNINEIVEYDAATTIKNNLNKHELSMFLGGATNDFATGVNSNAKIHADGTYKVNLYENLTLINLNTSKRGIRASNVSQWDKLKKDLNNVNTQHLILSTSTPVFGTGGFTDTREAELLHELLGEAEKKGINVFVVQKSNQSSSETKDGIRYINLNCTVITKPEQITSIPILEFIVDGANITYQIRPIFTEQK